MVYSDALLYEATAESNEIEGVLAGSRAFQNHWHCTLLARTAAQEGQLLHPRVYHQLLFEGTLAARSLVGNYRPAGFDVCIVRDDGTTVEAPDALMVPRLMESWWGVWMAAFLTGRPNPKDALVRWRFHAWFEAVHPFFDGNGRVGRLLWWNMAMIYNKDIEIVTADERKSYYRRLDNWLKDHAHKPLMNPFR